MPSRYLQAAEALKAGQVIAHPTETVWGLGADPFQEKALARLAMLKERPENKGWILLLPHRQALDNLVFPPSPQAIRLMNHFWPGPLTLVLPALPHLPAALTGGEGKIAVRLSSSPVIARLMDHFQSPMISTSANRRGQPPARDEAEIRAIWPRIPLLPGRVAPHALPSTVVMPEEKGIRILRQGIIPFRDLAALFPDLPLLPPVDNPPQ